MTLIIRGGTPKRASTSHSSTRSTETYAFARSIKQISSEILLVRPSSCSLRTTNIISVVECWARKPHCSSGKVAKSIGHDFEENLASMCHQREAPVVSTLVPILFLASNFDGGIFPLLRYFPHHPTMMSWKTSKMSWELSKSPFTRLVVRMDARHCVRAREG